MSAALQPGSQVFAAIPLSQNTAPVHEFRCLYTHDVKKKKKKWQDGNLRFHTFNKRIMVYDVPGSLVGDTYWHEAQGIQEGDEVTLDKGVLVEVSEPMGTTDTDLAPLLQKPNKQSPMRPLSERMTPGRATAVPAVTVAHSSVAPIQSQHRHRSLNAILGTPKGPTGRATIPTVSPFEARHAAQHEQWEQGPTPKRPRMGPPEPWGIVKTTKTPKPVTRHQAAPPTVKKVDLKRKTPSKPAQPEPGQKRFKVKEVIDITSDTDGGTQDLPETERPLPAVHNAARPRAPAGIPNETVPVRVGHVVGNVPQIDAAQPREDPDGRVAAPPLEHRPTAVRTMHAVNRSAARHDVVQRRQPSINRASSPPISTTSRELDVEARIDALEAEVGASESGRKPPTPEQPKGKLLRLAPRQPRNKLLCQELPAAPAIVRKSKPYKEPDHAPPRAGPSRNVARQIDELPLPALAKSHAPLRERQLRAVSEDQEQKTLPQRQQQPQRSLATDFAIIGSQAFLGLDEPDEEGEETHEDATRKDKKQEDDDDFFEVMESPALRQQRRKQAQAAKDRQIVQPNLPQKRTPAAGTKAGLYKRHRRVDLAQDEIDDDWLLAIDDEPPPNDQPPAQPSTKTNVGLSRAAPNNSRAPIVKMPMAGTARRQPAFLDPIVSAPPTKKPKAAVQPAPPTSLRGPAQGYGQGADAEGDIKAQSRPFRRIQSENDKPVPAGAPRMVATIATRNASAFTGPYNRTNRAMQRSASDVMRRPAQPPPERAVQPLPPPKDTSTGPWTKEAFDLFDWRPPGRDLEWPEGYGVGKGDEVNEGMNTEITA